MNKENIVCKLCPLNCKLSKEIPVGLCRVIGIKNSGLISLNNGAFEYGIHYIEELGFYHLYPGSTALYLLFPGCNLRCLFCPEWKIVMKKPAEIEEFTGIINPEKIIDIAINEKVDGIVLSCNSILNYDYIRLLIKSLSNKNLYLSAITNGVINIDYLLDIIRKIDGFLIRFFGFTIKSYSKVSIFPQGHLKALETVNRLVKMNKHVEVSYTVIRGINDSTDELNSFFTAIREISNDIPVHIRRFKPNYMMLDRTPTRNKSLVDTYKLAKKLGLNYVYIDDIFEGNEKNTYCPKDGYLLVRRIGNWVDFSLTSDKKCPACGIEIPLKGKVKRTLDRDLLTFKRS